MLVATALLPARPLCAQSEREPTAREHFEAGYRLVEQGALDAAIEEFEQAYQKSPHFSVLYNLGQAYASIGRSVEVVDRLTRYLELGGAQINEARVRQVREFIAYHSRRIGSVLLEVQPAGARVSVDGKVLDSSARSTPVPLTLGTHGIVAEHPGYATASINVRIVAGETAHASLVLEALPPVLIRVTCAIPDVTVSVDGAASSLPATGLLQVRPGEHRLGFGRPGYISREQTVRIEANETYDCALASDPNAKDTASLRVRHPRGTVALLDGAPHAARPVPAGRHRISVAGPGFERAERTVTLAAHRTQTVDLMPSPSSAALLARQSDQERTRRIVGLTVGAVGVSAVLVATGLYLYNNGEYDDWRAENARILARFQGDPSSVSAQEIDAIFEEENRIHNRDAVATGIGVFGMVSVVAATALLLWPSSRSDVLIITGSAPAARLRF
ncbi:MAG TPA: PEGA domain-containing protein [Polyangiaceae bacterium]